MSNKELIRTFYEEVFNNWDLSHLDDYMKDDYIQHNPGVTQGRAGLMEGFAKKFEVDPTFHLEIKMMIEDGDMIAVYLKNVDPEGNTKCRVVDIYRMEDGKLAEHWDVLQPC